MSCPILPLKHRVREQRVDQRDQLVRIKRLGEVGGGPGLVPLYAVGGEPLGRQQHKRHAAQLGRAPQPAEKGEAVHIWHDDVGDDQVGRRGL
ncbi:MAG: hypothetical protein SGPRY_013399 [Prymnesium sp.]